MRLLLRRCAKAGAFCIIPADRRCLSIIIPFSAIFKRFRQVIYKKAAGDEITGGDNQENNSREIVRERKARNSAFEGLFPIPEPKILEISAPLLHESSIECRIALSTRVLVVL